MMSARAFNELACKQSKRFDTEAPGQATGQNPNLWPSVDPGAGQDSRWFNGPPARLEDGAGKTVILSPCCKNTIMIGRL